ncbi:hypothetical protein AsAng_0060680 [Aureispira anguillae]|uniref:Uncharacterized protein n=1 Tax=Aureispira anguillae TaxID=2864201 RepID=A0A915YL86_9BACT|nr:hypothetical protein AsAng_0060680 [Aureispira anguillae]
MIEFYFILPMGSFYYQFHQNVQLMFFLIKSIADKFTSIPKH